MTVQQFRYQDKHTETGRSYYTVKRVSTEQRTQKVDL